MGDSFPHIAIPTKEECLKRLERHVTKEKIGLQDPFFKNRSDTFFKDRLEEFSKNAEKMVTSLIKVDGCRKAEIALDLSVLTLYDLAIFIGLASPITPSPFIFKHISHCVVQMTVPLWENQNTKESSRTP